MCAFTIARGFLSMYGMAIDTIVLCFCEDLEAGDKDKDHDYFMGPSLRSAMGLKSNKGRSSSNAGDIPLAVDV